MASPMEKKLLHAGEGDLAQLAGVPHGELVPSEVFLQLVAQFEALATSQTLVQSVVRMN